MRPSCRIVLRLSAACLLAAAAVPSRLAEACHTYDHAQHLRGVGIGVPEEVMQKLKAIPVDFEPIASPALGATPCVGGMADVYPCENVDLLAFVPLENMGDGSGNDIWGWTDPETGVEWALMGRTNGTAFVSLEDPTDPVYVGNLPSQTGNSSTWRDIKVFDDHAFIVADGFNGHGIQIFDLTVLRTITTPPATFNPATDLTAYYNGIGSAHNIAINEDTGFAYAVGGDTCDGGLHMVNINDPANPTPAGCYSTDGYTHDVQCVVYQGIDAEHVGDEVCFASNEDTLTIVDVTNKSAPALLSRNAYAGSGYTHQGWLTPDQRFFLVDDELDHTAGGSNPRKTYVWYLANLESPTLLGAYEATGTRAPAIDHNQYVVGDVAFQANYRAGLSVLRIDDPATAGLTEIGYFDTYPDFDNPSFSGAWSNYPYFASGIVIVSDINRGLFVLQPNLPVNPIIFHDDFELGDPTAWSAVVP